MAAFDLKGKKCLVTGASKGMGRAIALAYAEQGTKLYLVARDEKTLHAVCEECKAAGAESAVALTVDMSDAEATQKMADELLAEGGVDVLVNNAGYQSRDNALVGDPDEWEALMQVNVLTPMLLCRTLSPKMVERKEGVIVNVGSYAGTVGKKNSGCYAASKAGIRGYSFGAFEALRKHNVKVVTLSPDYTNTGFIGGNPELDYSRLIQASDVAEAALLPCRLTAGCCPREVIMKVGRSAGGAT